MITIFQQKRVTKIKKKRSSHFEFSHTTDMATNNHKKYISLKHINKNNGRIYTCDKRECKNKKEEADRKIYTVLVITKRNKTTLKKKTQKQIK